MLPVEEELLRQRENLSSRRGQAGAEEVSIASYLFPYNVWLCTHSIGFVSRLHMVTFTFLYGYFSQLGLWSRYWHLLLVN